MASAQPPSFYPVTTPGGGAEGGMMPPYGGVPSTVPQPQYGSTPYGTGGGGTAYPGYNQGGIAAGRAAPQAAAPPAAEAANTTSPQPPSSTGLIRLTLRKPMGIVFEPMPASAAAGGNAAPSSGTGTGVRICDLPRTGAAALSRRLEVGDELLSINDVTMSRLTFDEIMDFIIAADPENVSLLFRRPRGGGAGAGAGGSVAVQQRQGNVEPPTPLGLASGGGGGGNNSPPMQQHAHGSPSSPERKGGGGSNNHNGDGANNHNNNGNNKEATVTWVDEHASQANTDGGTTTDGNSTLPPPTKSSRGNHKKHSSSHRGRKRETNSKKDTLLASESFLDMLIDSICAFGGENSGDKRSKRRHKDYDDDNSTRYSGTDCDDEYSQSQFSQSVYTDDGDGTYASESQYDSVISEDWGGGGRNKGASERGGRNSKNAARGQAGGRNAHRGNNVGGGNIGPNRDDESYTIDETVDEDDYTLETLDTSDRPQSLMANRMMNKMGMRQAGGRAGAAGAGAGAGMVPSRSRSKSRDEETGTFTESEYTRGDTTSTGDILNMDAGNVPLGLTPNRGHQQRHPTSTGGHGRGQGRNQHQATSRNIVNDPAPLASPPQEAEPIVPFDNSTGPPTNLPFSELNFNTDDPGDGADVSVLTNNMSQYGQSHVSPAALMHAHNYVPEAGKTLEQSIQDNPERFYRHAVRELLAQNEPEKVRLLDKLLGKYAGREEHLIQKLTLRYRDNAGGTGKGGGGEDSNRQSVVEKEQQQQQQQMHREQQQEHQDSQGQQAAPFKGEWATTPTIQEDTSFEEGKNRGGGGFGAGPSKTPTPPKHQHQPETPAYESLSSFASPDDTTKGGTVANDGFEENDEAEGAFGGGAAAAPAPAPSHPAPAASMSRSRSRSNDENGDHLRHQDQPIARQDSRTSSGGGRKGRKNRSRSRTGKPLVLSVSRSNSYADSDTETQDGDDDGDEAALAAAGVVDTAAYRSKSGEDDEFMQGPSGVASVARNAGAAKAPEEETIEVYQTEDEYSGSDSYSDGPSGSDYSDSDVDGTSPAVIAQVSELLNFVYGKTSVPGQIDRVSTIMRAYEGRENVLLELLETKALIKANSVGEQPPPPVTSGGRGSGAGGRPADGEANDGGNGQVTSNADRDNDDISSVSGMSSKFNVKVPLDSESVSPMVSPITQSIGQGEVDSPNKFPEFASRQKENVQSENTRPSPNISNNALRSKNSEDKAGKKKKGLIKKLFGGKKGKKKGMSVLDDASHADNRQPKKGSLQSMADVEAEI